MSTSLPLSELSESMIDELPLLLLEQRIRDASHRLFEYTRIAEGMTFREKILSPQYCVDRNGEAVYVGDDTCPLRWGDARA